MVIETLTTLIFCRKNSHPHICLYHAIHVSKLTLTSPTPPHNSWNVIQASSAHLTNILAVPIIVAIYCKYQCLFHSSVFSKHKLLFYLFLFEMVNYPVINILIVPECKIRKRHYWLIFKLPWRHCWHNSVQWFSVFLYHDSWKNAWKTFCVRIGHVVRCSGIKCWLITWRHRIKRQS